MTIRGMLLDNDGTLVLSNDAHAKAWREALAEHGYAVSYDKLRGLLGMGGDKVLPGTARGPALARSSRGSRTPLCLSPRHCPPTGAAATISGRSAETQTRATRRRWGPIPLPSMA